MKGSAADDMGQVGKDGKHKGRDSEGKSEGSHGPRPKSHAPRWPATESIAPHIRDWWRAREKKPASSSATSDILGMEIWEKALLGHDVPPCVSLPQGLAAYKSRDFPLDDRTLPKQVQCSTSGAGLSLQWVWKVTMDVESNN